MEEAPAAKKQRLSLVRALHSPEPEQSQHRESYSRRSSGALRGESSDRLLLPLDATPPPYDRVILAKTLEGEGKTS